MFKDFAHPVEALAALGTAQRAMKIVLEMFKWQGLLVHVDDVYIIWRYTKGLLDPRQQVVTSLRVRGVPWELKSNRFSLSACCSSVMLPALNGSKLWHEELKKHTDMHLHAMR